MKRLLPLIALFTLSAAYAAEEFTFGPVLGNAGQSVRVLTLSETRDGVFENKKGEETTIGNIRIVRDRDITWTFRDPAEDGALRSMVEIAKILTVTSTKINGVEESSTDTSPLGGQMFALTKPKSGDWQPVFKGQPPSQRVLDDLEEMKLYLKRQWLPNKPVKLGDTWEFDPVWIRSIIEKDLPNIQTIGTMKLARIRYGDKNLAEIEISIRSAGVEKREDGSEARAKIELNGKMAVNLKTMLDESIELEGVVVTGNFNATESKTATLPIKLKVSKSFVGGP